MKERVNGKVKGVTNDKIRELLDEVKGDFTNARAIADLFSAIERELPRLLNDSDAIEWLGRATVEAKVYIDGHGWMRLDRESIGVAMHGND